MLLLAEHLLKNPQDLEKFAEDGTRKSLKVKFLTSSSKGQHIIFYDEELVNQITDNQMQLDGTFNSIPQVKGVGQMFTIMAKKYNVVSCFA